MCDLDIKERISDELEFHKIFYISALFGMVLIFAIFVIYLSINNILFFLVPLTIYLLFILFINEILKSRFFAIRAFSLFLFIIFEILVLLCFFAPIAVDIQPPELRENVILTNGTSSYNITEFISLNNLGRKVDINWKSEHIENFVNPSSGMLSLHSNKKELIKVTLSIPKNTTSGIYRGIIKIQLKSNESSIDKSIPVTLNVTNKIT